MPVRRKACQVGVGTARAGPSRSLESRTSTTSGVVATCPRLPLAGLAISFLDCPSPQCGLGQCSQNVPVRADLLRFLQEHAGGLVLQIPHWLEFGELHQPERAGLRGVGTERDRHYP